MIAPPKGNKGITVPPSAVLDLRAGTDFKDLKGLPVGTQSFVTPLAQAREAAFSIQPASAGSGPPGGSSPSNSFEVRMDVSCVSPDAATALARVFTSLTDVIRSLVVSERVSPKPSDLTAVLVSGRFEAHESTVTGLWPMDRHVIESLVSGQIK